VPPPQQETIATVLYVEDNPANRRLVESLFRLRPYVELLTAEDAQTGLEMAQHHAPALIILDIDLPGMNGYEALEILRANSLTANIPVYALTAAAMVTDVEKGMSAGFKKYITKPVQVGDFLQCIDEALKTNSS
jgi:CheY-like chemotaxis protein